MHKLNAALLARILPKSLFVAGAILCSLVGSLLLSSPTHAQQPAALPASLVKQAKQRALMEGMYSCLANSGTGTVGVDSVVAGKLSGITMHGHEYVSPLFDEGGDAALNCESEIPQAIKDIFGYASYIDMVCEFGFAAFDPSDGCDKNSSNYGSSKRYQFHTGVLDELKQALIRRSSSSIGEKDNNLLNYVVAYTALTSSGSAACRATFVGAKSSDGEQNAAISAGKGVSAWVAGRDGAFDAFYRFAEGKNKDTGVNMFSYSFQRSIGRGNPIGGWKKCSEIAQWVSDLAPKVANTLVQAGNESTSNEVVSALTSKFCQGLTGYPLSSCQDQVKKWVAACQSKLPTSGSVAESNEYVNCLAQQSGKYLDDIKAALGSISIPDESSETEAEEVTCAIEGVGWMICPVVRFMADMSDNIYGFLSNDFLRIETKLFDTNNNTYTAWVVIRNIANSLFVIAFIFIIFSQLTGIGMSNYGIKKMLPMLLIAALLVNMSYFICQLAVDLSNILGNSLYGMFSGWAGNMNTGNYAAVDELTTEGVIGGIAILVLAGVGGYLALSALSAAAIATIIALLSVFLLLIARKALVILLVVIAPLAFVALLLPNTQSLFTKWRKIFVSMLLVYPIIGLLFGAGSLAATILNEAADENDIIMQIVGALSAVLPLFMVIPVLKKSMDAGGAITAAINNASGKFTGVAQSKASDAYKRSIFGAYSEQRKRAKDLRRQQIIGGVYKGRGGIFNLRNLASGINRGLNTSRITGQAGTNVAAHAAKMAVKLQVENVEAQTALIEHANVPIDDLLRIASGRQALSAGGRGIDHNDINAQAAAAAQLAKRGEYDKFNQAWDYAVSQNDKNADARRRVMADTIARSEGKPEYIGQGALQNMRDNQSLGNNSLSLMQTAIVNNTYSPSTIVNTSRQELSIIADTAKTMNSADVAGIRGNANAALNDRRLSSSIGKNRDVIQNISNL